MRNTKGDRTLLVGSLALVALLLLGGTWANKRDEYVKAKLGRYRTVSMALPVPTDEIELKENGQWGFPGGGGINGTYAIAGDEITFSSKDCLTFKGRFTEDGFIVNTTTSNTLKPLYKKIP